jgi:hypothetical protein
MNHDSPGLITNMQQPQSSHWSHPLQTPESLDLVQVPTGHSFASTSVPISERQSSTLQNLQNQGAHSGPQEPIEPDFSDPPICLDTSFGPPPPDTATICPLRVTIGESETHVTNLSTV